MKYPKCHPCLHRAVVRRRRAPILFKVQGSMFRRPAPCALRLPPPGARDFRLWTLDFGLWTAQTVRPVRPGTAGGTGRNSDSPMIAGRGTMGRLKHPKAPYLPSSICYLLLFRPGPLPDQSGLRVWKPPSFVKQPQHFKGLQSISKETFSQVRSLRLSGFALKPPPVLTNFDQF